MCDLQRCFLTSHQAINPFEKNILLTTGHHWTCLNKGRFPSFSLGFTPKDWKQPPRMHFHEALVYSTLRRRHLVADGYKIRMGHNKVSGLRHLEL